jgi:hypothetical protein
MNAIESVAEEVLAMSQQVWMIDGEHMANRGMSDALAGKPAATEHPHYGEAFALGGRLKQAVEGNLVLAMNYATSCPCCGLQWLGHGDKCPRQCHNDATPLLHGILCFYGSYESGDEPSFMNLACLRQLAVDGLRIVNPDGVCINCEILIQ